MYDDGRIISKPQYIHAVTRGTCVRCLTIIPTVRSANYGKHLLGHD